MQNESHCSRAKPRASTLTILGLCLSLFSCGEDKESKTEGVGSEDSGTHEPDAGVEGEAPPVKIDRSKLTDVGVGSPLDYADNALWMCRPDNDPNECHRNLDATELKPDGSRSVVKHVFAEKPAFDCFYVYPTVLLTGAAQMIDFTPAGVEAVLDPLLSQGAPFSSVCEVYAPLYRQTGLSGGRPVAGADMALAVQDVRDAFAYYLKHLNRGRKFVLVAHSQGTSMLTQMMIKDVDPVAEVRAQLISALLIGFGVYVPPGKLVGGTFNNLPLCSKEGETGCVIAYASYSADAPPTSSSLFGKPSMGNEWACVNPATLSGNTGAYTGSIFPITSTNPSFVADTMPPKDITTPFVLYRGMFKGECVTRGEFHYLEYTLVADKNDPRGIPPWRHTAVDALGFGTHLVDFQVALEDLIKIVEKQAAAAK
jgi:Protein of unknown function (DUF3089)